MNLFSKQFLLQTVVVVALGGLFCSPGDAGPFIQVEGGWARPFTMSHIGFEYASQGAATNDDLTLHSAAAVGGKIGYHFETAPWLGVNVEGLYTTPHLKQQTTAIHSLKGTQATTAYTVGGSYEHIWTGGLNLTLAYPGERWQPYVEGGPAFFSANQGGMATLRPQIGLNAESGLRYRITAHWVVSVAYKFQQAALILTDHSGPNGSLNGLSSHYQNQFVLGGVGYTF